MGVMLEFKDSIMSRTWICKSAEQGYMLAQYMLGKNLFFVSGSESDVVKWYQKAAEQGLAEAQYSLGISILAGGWVPFKKYQDKKKSHYWISKAAENGWLHAQEHMGDCYYEGRDVEKDYDKALLWYHRAVEQDYWTEYNRADIEYKLGKTYLMRKNREECFIWVRKAAESGYCKVACAILGYLYEEGVGVKEDMDQAKYWYQKSGYDDTAIHKMLGR